MLQALPAILTTLLLAVSILGQSTPSTCPKLEVIGPAGEMMPGEPSTFVLRTEQDFPEVYRYQWSVENGTITNGQGTRGIEVASMVYGSKVTVTVTVTGLSGECPKSVSATASIAQHLPLEWVDEWGELPNDDQRGRLDLFFIELSNDPTLKGLIIVYSKDKATERRRLKLYLDHARFRKFDKSLLTFCLMVVGRTSTMLYRLTPDFLDKPEPNCTLVPGSLLK